MAGEQVPGEDLTEGMHVKVYVVEVRRSTRGPQVLISRTHPGLVKRLFELEVPEIYDGTVEVKSIAREAGSRTKMAVWSNDENVDPIGACVGPKGQRVGSHCGGAAGRKDRHRQVQRGPGPVYRRRPGACRRGGCGWRTRARPAASSCRMTSCPWPSARRDRTPAWRPASPATKSTSSPGELSRRRRAPCRGREPRHGGRLRRIRGRGVNPVYQKGGAVRCRK